MVERIATAVVVALLTLGCQPLRNADADRDGAVTPLDATLVASCVGADLAALAACRSSDVDADGDVDAADLAFVEQRAGLSLPALATSAPAAGAVGVPRTAWLVLDFADPVASGALDTISLACAGAPHPLRRSLASQRRVVANPSPELPAGASCLLSWRGPVGIESLEFETAAAGAPATVLYDRTDPSAMAPFPDDYWLVPDPSTPTGQRVALAAPAGEPDVVQLFESLIVDTAALDGFSPLAMITAELSDAPDPASLPMTVEATVDPLASVGLFDLTPGSATFGERVPFRLHLRSDDLPGQPTAHSIVAFPSIPLAPGGRYGFVVTRRALVDPTRPFGPSPFLAAAMAPPADGEDPAVAAVRVVVRDVLDPLDRATPPIQADDVALALRITVRDTSAIPRDVLAMKEQVLAEAPPAVTVTSVQSSQSAGPTIVRGTWQAPSWRQGAFLARDAAGAPRITRRVAVPFVLALPAAASSGAVPVVMYQHGNPGTVDDLQQTAAHLVRAGFAVVGFTDPINRAYSDLGAQYTGIFGTLLFGGHLPDLWVQTYGEQLAFLRALETLATRDFLPRNAPDGIPELDLSRPLGYMGLSYGGNHGQAFLAYAPEIRAGAIIASAARLAELLFHQDQTDPLEIGSLLSFISAQVPNARAPEVWAGLSIFQMIYDVQDPQNHAAFLHGNPIEVAGTTRKASLLVVEGIADSFTPSNAIRSLAWTAGPLAQLAPIRDPVRFLDARDTSVTANLGPDATGALVQYECYPGGEGHYCAQEGSQAQQTAFFRSALDPSRPPVILADDLDSDADQLADVDEITRGTDPDRADTDGDGLADGLEVRVGLNPSNAADAAADRDLDGIANAAELALGTSIDVRDSDFDGLIDGDEVARGTNALQVDTDGGGRSDGQEVNLDHTDPLARQDDLPIADLPVVVFDGTGFRWEIGPYQIESGTADAFDFGLQTSFRVGTDAYYMSDRLADREDGGREIAIGPESRGLLRIARKVYVPSDAGFARVLDVIENTSENPIAAQVHVTTRLAAFRLDGVVTSSGDASFDVADEFIVTDGAGASSPAVSHLFSGPGALVEPDAASLSGTTGFPSLSYRFPLVVPPRGRSIVLQFAVQAGTSAEAEARTEALHLLGAGALDGVSSAERKAIVNFACAPDADADGILDFDEIAFGTDAADPDSDDDGLRDGFEADNGFDLLVAGEQSLDPDADGADNTVEQQAGTSPTDADTDDDRLDDGAEIALSTDPLHSDTDRDGMSDADEIDAGIDPLDADADSDGDGITDVDEVRGGMNPFDADTDGDGLRDDVELGWGFDPTDPSDGRADDDADGLDVGREIELGTSFWEFDSDYDELGDGDEVARGTNPLVEDSDGGGRSDGREVLADETDPIDPLDDLQRVAAPVLLEDGGGNPWTIREHEVLGGVAAPVSYSAWVNGTAAIHSLYAEDGGREIVADGHVGRRKVYVPPDASFVRILEIIEYPPSLMLELRLDIYLFRQSASGVELVATSSGAATLSAADDYFVNDDADGAGSPAVAHLYSGPGAPTEPSWSDHWSPSGGVTNFTFPVGMHPRRILMVFLALADTRAEAIAIAEHLRELPPEALAGMSALERAAVVNFAVPSSP